MPAESDGEGLSTAWDYFERGPWAHRVERLAIQPATAPITLVDISRPGVDVSAPAMSDLLLVENVIGGVGVDADIGGGRFRHVSPVGRLYPIAPSVARPSCCCSASGRWRC